MSECLVKLDLLYFHYFSMATKKKSHKSIVWMSYTFIIISMYIKSKEVLDL